MKKHLNDQLFELIATSIRKGRLKPGTLLLEGPMADLFGVSRSPVRQALLNLHQAGLVCTFDGRGYLVGAQPGKVLRRKLEASDFKLTDDRTQAPRKTETWKSVYDQIERDLLHQSLFGTYRINELELSRHYAISRTVSRQVLTRLSLMGLVERDELTAGSTWHAAGLLPLFNMSYATTHIHKYSVDFYKGLEAETGLNAGFAVVGNDHPIAPGSRYYNADLPQTVYDPEKARFLLKKAMMPVHKQMASRIGQDTINEIYKVTGFDPSKL